MFKKNDSDVTDLSNCLNIIIINITLKIEKNAPRIYKLCKKYFSTLEKDIY